MRFDYLHSARPLLVQRILDVRVPDRFHSALFALIGSAAVIAGAWGIDAFRLREALRVEAVYQQRHDESARALRRTNVYYDRVKALIDLDRHVRQIAASGDADARTLAEIANRLPAHAWLTGISHDATGFALDGRAKDLGVLSSVIQGLMHAEHLRSPTLISAALDKERGRDTAMNYQIHIDRATP
ncbi:MAG TPA: PilN domain-containing protein [Candidatus Baltobacteraceae bacterium]|nr:PilN domain-containing protein [Candidatus Baltobacteraceae bacterium]